jgi:multidrug efflux pump subunit AcrB
VAGICPIGPIGAVLSGTTVRRRLEHRGRAALVVVMFNAVRQPLVIWLTVPLSIVGVAIGLLLFQVPFEFMAILGFLSLIGMLVKNAIVLVDEADSERREGKAGLAAVLDASVSRARPSSSAH